MAVREYAVLGMDELEDGTMRSVAAGGTDVLLVRDGDAVSAVGPKCTHYGAPLENGVLIDGVIHCPWHKACFRASTGAVTAPPALDSLPSYPVRIEDGQIHVSVPDDAPETVSPVAVPLDAAPDDRTFVIVGAGAAGGYAAQRLRLEGFRGRLVLVSDEDEVPYDRTKLSKPFLGGQQGADQLPLRPAGFYEQHAIERLTATVRNIDLATRTVTFTDGAEPIVADGLLVASGAEPRQLDVPGADLANVFTLREVRDAERIITATGENANVVIVGDGFIGLEAAASLTQRGASVTVVTRSGTPLAGVLGEEVAGVLKRLHERKGVRFVTGSVDRFEGDAFVTAVGLEGGKTVSADLVVVGVGVSPRTAVLSGVETNADGGVTVGPDLRVADGVWLAGDIAEIDANGRRIEHWRLAQQMGWTAAEGMLGREARTDDVPYFWTNQFGTRVDVAGRTSGDLRLVVDGETTGEKPAFLAWYLDGDTVVGAAAVQRDQDMIRLIDRWERGETISAGDVGA